MQSHSVVLWVRASTCELGWVGDTIQTITNRYYDDDDDGGGYVNTPWFIHLSAVTTEKKLGFQFKNFLKIY